MHKSNTVKCVLLFSQVYVNALPYDHIILINFGAQGLVEKDPSVADDDASLTAQTVNNKQQKAKA